MGGVMKNSKIGSLKYLPLIAVLASCSSTLDRLEAVGKPPAMQQIQNPVQQASYQPLTWPTPIEPYAPPRGANSLWQTGSKSFFKDQRASRVGDILTVMIDINDEADLTNNTDKSRNTQETLAAPRFLGLEEKLLKVLPGDPQLSDFLNITGSSANSGDGTIAREEEINLKLAAIVTQVLPNGNLVIHGTQEVRVNYEMRQVNIDGVIRPEDISSSNTINSDQIAEARVSYGGKGQLSDVQQPRLGTQVIDILSPF